MPVTRLASAHIANDHDLPHVWLKPAKGAPAAYYRRARLQGNHVIRLRGADGKPVLPGQPGFRSAWERAHREFEGSYQVARQDEQEAAVALPYGIDNLIRSYKQSEDWQRLKSEVSREAYTRRCKLLSEAIHQLKPMADMSRIDRQFVFQLQAAMVTGRSGKRAPSSSNEGIRMLSLLIRHAIDLGWRRMGDNPARDMRPLHSGDGHRAWTEADVHAVLTNPEIHVAVKTVIAAARYTGLRLADLCTLARDARADGVLVHKTKKTGAMVYLPVHPELARWIDAAPAHAAPTLLANPSGKPWDADYLSHVITHAVRTAGLNGLSCHGLRKSATIAAAEAGLSDAEIESLIPHADQKMTRYYREQASQKLLAQRAMAKLSGC